MDGENCLPLLVAHFVNHRIPRVTGIVDDDVDGAEFLNRRIDDQIRKGAVCDIAWDAYGLTTGRDNRGDRLFRRCRIDITKRYTSALLCEYLRRRAANTPTCTGYYCCFPFK